MSVAADEMETPKSSCNLVSTSSGGKSPRRMQKDRAHPYSNKKKENKKAAVEKLKKSIYLPDLPVKEPPKMILPVKKPLNPTAPKLVPDEPWEDSPKVVEPQHERKPEDTEIVEIETVELQEQPESGKIVDSSEGNFTFDAFLRNVLDEAPITYPCPIHNTPIEELQAKDPTSSAVYLRCAELNCPVFTNLNDCSLYYYQCRK